MYEFIHFDMAPKINIIIFSMKLKLDHLNDFYSLNSVINSFVWW